VLPATKLWLLSTTVFIAIHAHASDLQRSLFGPSVAELRPKAEAGDPIAQGKLGEAYRWHSDKTNALYWLRKAARQGNAEAQFNLGSMFSGAERLKWHLLAANQNYADAQFWVASFLDGTGKKEDRIEAYKWRLVYDKQRGFQRPALDALALKMPQADILEAEKRAAAFVPAKPIRIEPELKLQSIIGTQTHRLAMINGHTFATGEQATLKIDDETVSAKCVEISDRTAVVDVNGTRRTLSLQ
jgi:TPR repeat protein